jgi:hypothetical protein
MATVPMLAPDGQSGEIPQDKVQDALKAGFKQAVEMTSPDGKTGYIPADRQQDALRVGFKLTAPTPPGMLEPHGDWTDVLRGAAQGIKQLVSHPFDSVSQVPSIAATPTPTIYGSPSAQGQAVGAQNQAVAENANNIRQQVQAAKEHPAYMAGEIIGPALATHGAAKLLPKIPKVMGRAALLGKTPEAVYESALKPSTALSPSDRAEFVRTGLENELPVSKGGLERLGDLIDSYNQAIEAEINTAPNRPIDPNKVATRADIARAKFARQVNARRDLKSIESSREEFLDEQGRTAGTPAQPTGILDAQGNPIMRPALPAQPAPAMNASDAQAMKRGTYQVLAGKFGEQGSASVEAQKALARGLKEEIANQFPEISKLNAAESRLLDLQPILERAVNRASNHQAVGIGTPLVGTAAKALTGSTLKAAVIALVKSVIDNPHLKSRLAIAVSKGGKIPYAQAMAKVEGYSYALGLAAGAQAGMQRGASSEPRSSSGDSDVTASPGWSQ